MAVAAGWLSIALVARWLLQGSVRGPDHVPTALVARGIQLYVRLVHSLRIEGREHLPPAGAGSPLILIANHTAGIDPLVIQAGIPYDPRWMMGSDMMIPGLDWLWELARIIPVERFGEGDPASLRAALKHLKSGGVVGVFPEGSIERPPRHILPFQAGVGLLIRRSGAPVLPIIIDGTPQVDPAWASLWKLSRTSVRFLPVIDYASSGLDAQAIADDLRARFVAATGWPTSDLLPKRIDGRLVFVGLDGRYEDETATL
jgi:1-acyl-sn-glycerol-3-phosphate acyltransferase